MELRHKAGWGAAVLLTCVTGVARAVPDETVTRLLAKIDCMAAKRVCEDLRGYQAAHVAKLPAGDSFSVGNAALVSNAGKTSDAGYYVVMARVAKGKTLADGFDPRPENADEAKGIADYLAALQQGKRLRENALHMFVMSQFGNRELFPTWVKDDALSFSFSEEQQQDIVSLRQAGKKLYVLARTHELGVPFLLIAVLPAP